MESTTVDREKELEATPTEPRITEARPLPPTPRSSSRKLAIFGALAVLAAMGSICGCIL